MTIRVKNAIWPANAQYPNAWRGERSIIIHAGLTNIRLMYFPAKRENDWMRVDTATTLNISPRWAKWFHICRYYAGRHGRFLRNIYHFTVGHVCLSVVPGQTTSW